MLNTTPTTDHDFASALRDAAKYQYVACLSTNSPAVAEVLPNCLNDRVYKVNSIYRARVTWVMNSATAGAVRKLKDSQGAYYWSSGLGGQPDRLLGYPVQIWEDMQDIGANNIPIGFGDFRRGYLLVDRHAMRITAVEVTEPGQTKFYVRRREGGTLLSNDAL